MDRKKLISLLMSAAMAFSAVTTTAAQAEANLASVPGTISSLKTVDTTAGANITWELSGGTLYLKGSGAMYNYDMASYVPWYEKPNLS